MESQKKTLVFIDDSGDPGFKLESGSSRFFVISAVVFSDDLEAEKTAVAIKELRRELGISDTREFKFNKSDKRIRELFLRKVIPFEFKIRSLIIDKALIRSSELRGNKNSFYSYAIKLLLQHSNNSILDARIKIDGSGDRLFKKSFATYLRKSLNTQEKKIMKQVKFIDSKENALIQLADMIAGSEKRYFEYRDGSKTDTELYRNIFKNKIEDEWKFR